MVSTGSAQVKIRLSVGLTPSPPAQVTCLVHAGICGEQK